MATLASGARVASPRRAVSRAGRCAVCRVRARASPRALDAASAADAGARAEGAWGATARACVAWLARQPGNLREVTPLLRWPNETLLAWGTVRGVVGNACAVVLALTALTALLGGADAILLATRTALAAKVGLGMG